MPFEKHNCISRCNNHLFFKPILHIFFLFKKVRKKKKEGEKKGQLGEFFESQK